MSTKEKIEVINKAIKNYFSKNNVSNVTAIELHKSELSDYFSSDKTFRSFLRKIKKSGELRLIPSTKHINKNDPWFFYNSKDCTIGYRSNQINNNKSIAKQQIPIKNKVVDESTIEELFIPVNFCSISELPLKKAGELNGMGFYCIKLKGDGKLPNNYKKHLKSHQILYIGIAKGQTLKKRLLNQEINAIGHGTFFRSVGAMLGYRPAKGSLLNKSNKKNYTFSTLYEEKIKQWLINNVVVNCINYDNFAIEGEIIAKYCPMLNHKYNPEKLDILEQDRAECREIANTPLYL